MKRVAVMIPDDPLRLPGSERSGRPQLRDKGFDRAAITGPHHVRCFSNRETGEVVLAYIEREPLLACRPWRFQPSARRLVRGGREHRRCSGLRLLKRGLAVSIDFATGFFGISGKVRYPSGELSGARFPCLGRRGRAHSVGQALISSPIHCHGMSMSALCRQTQSFRALHYSGISG